MNLTKNDKSRMGKMTDPCGIPLVPGAASEGIPNIYCLIMLCLSSERWMMDKALINCI